MNIASQRRHLTLLLVKKNSQFQPGWVLPNTLWPVAARQEAVSSYLRFRNTAR